MKLASFLLLTDAAYASPRTGVVVESGVVDVSAVVEAITLDGSNSKTVRSGMLALLGCGPQALNVLRTAAAQAADALIPLTDVRLLAPLPRPGKIVAIGRNYADHVKEAGLLTTDAPRIIAKLPSSVVGPGSIVRAPSEVVKLDFEVELAVVIGAYAKNVNADDALEYVAGYSILNDLSAREFQFDVSPPQTTFAKSMDGFCPFGPWIVTADEIADPQSLNLRCWLNGTLMQNANTSQMIHSVRNIIAYTSKFMTLEPGDVIATGTPSGVGLGRTPPVWLRPGDHLRLEIEKIGVLEHAIG
jgi:2-keto-4-pentenoate hydratase/2-oxohepta-3-ene-1,7-dioic acid hydratase in catechol pathway